MSLTSLVSGLQKRTSLKFTDASGKAQVFLIDVTASDSHQLDTDVTDSPVETGPDVSDHARTKPVMVSLEGYVSESPLTLNEDFGFLASSGGAIVGGKLAGGFGGGIAGGAAGVVGSKLLQSGSPDKNAREVLEYLQASRILFSYVGTRKQYDNMMITSLTFPRDSSTGRGLQFSLKMKQLRLVKAQTVQIKSVAKSAAGASKKQELGNQPTTVDSGKKSSLLYSAIKGVFGK